MTLDGESLLQLLFVAITSRGVSLWLWKSLENSEFFLLLWPPGMPSSTS